MSWPFDLTWARLWNMHKWMGLLDYVYRQSTLVLKTVSKRGTGLQIVTLTLRLLCAYNAVVSQASDSNVSIFRLYTLFSSLIYWVCLILQTKTFVPANAQLLVWKFSCSFCFLNYIIYYLKESYVILLAKQNSDASSIIVLAFPCLEL